MSDIFILCGHYEGVDQRVLDKIVDEEISIGDYVVSGGELPALVLVDSVVRVLDGVLSQPDCYEDESHFNGLLEYPQYTRPEVWGGRGRAARAAFRSPCQYHEMAARAVAAEYGKKNAPKCWTSTR